MTDIGPEFRRRYLEIYRDRAKERRTAQKAEERAKRATERERLPRGARREGDPCARCGGTIFLVRSGDCTTCNKSKYRQLPLARRLLYGAKHRAASHGIPFDLSLEQMQAKVPVDGRCPACCELMVVGGPHTPSVDRLVCPVGYTDSNVSIICRRCNTIKNDATLADLRRLVAWMESR